MKPYGLIKNVKFHCKRDCHPRRKYGEMNWWEDECCNIVKRGSLNQIWKKEVKEELLDHEDYLDELKLGDW